MKVSAPDNYEKGQLERLNSELKHKITQKESEIEKVKNLYDKKIEEENKIGEQSYLTRVDENNQKLINASKDAEVKLKSYNDNLEKTKNELAMQDKNLRENNKTQIDNLKNQHGEIYQGTYENAVDNEREIQFKTHNELKNLNENSKRDITSLQNKTRSEISALSVNFNNQTLENERTFRARIDEDVKSHQEQVQLQKEQFKKDITLASDKNKRLETEKIRVQTDELNYLDAYHKNLMDQREKDFKVRYENQAKEHERVLNDIKTKLESDIQKAQQAAEVTIKTITSKSEDPFYRIEKLNPELSEVPKGYVVTLKVPEHERENVHLIAHGREMKLTFNKRFADSVVDEDGTTNRSSKNQVYSKEFKTAEILNPKNISEKYENGVLTFKVDKL